MSDSATGGKDCDLQALTDFVLSDELGKLEESIDGFSLFHTLGLESRELAHSQVLAWLLQPDESHGFGDLFLRRWLMRVVRDAESTEPKLPSAPEIEAVEWVQIDVKSEVAMSRENRLDVVATLRERGLHREPLWVVAIEVKVDSKEGNNQLGRYKAILERRLPLAERRVFVYLTKKDLPPGDSSWTRCGFNTVLETLREGLAQKSEAIGSGPKLLLDNYKSLLEEEFVKNEKIEAAVRNIIKTHGEAVKLILKYKSDPLNDWTRRLRDELKAKANDFGICVKESDGRDYIEFAPKIWNPPDKLKRAAVLCVLDVGEDGVGLRVYATYHCDGALKRNLVALANKRTDVFKKGTARRQEADQPTLDSDWWVDSPEMDDVNQVIDELGKELSNGRLKQVLEEMAKVIQSHDNGTTIDGSS
ncbi:MAG: PD-(D/E)XK nuclease family protein [Verrucomicrobiales bacterium]|nr:PD-(D/E)XK nuclease family protein [Verrucomicrobiales bacterium]